MKFGKKLAAFKNLLLAHPRYRLFARHLIDYKLLKQILKSDILGWQSPVEEVPVHLTVAEDKTSNSGFLACLMKQIAIIEEFYSSQEKSLIVRKADLDIKVALYQSGNNNSSSSLFSSSQDTPQPLIIPDSLLKEAEMLEQDARWLLQFTSISGTAVIKIVKKHDKNAAKFGLPSSLNVGPLVLPLLFRLGHYSSTHPAKISNELKLQLSLSCAQMQNEFNSTCPVCLSPWSKPVTLSCGHVFCLSCLGSIHDRTSSVSLNENHQKRQRLLAKTKTHKRQSAAMMIPAGSPPKNVVHLDMQDSVKKNQTSRDNLLSSTQSEIALIKKTKTGSSSVKTIFSTQSSQGVLEFDTQQTSLKHKLSPEQVDQQRRCNLEIVQMQQVSACTMRCNPNTLTQDDNHQDSCKVQQQGRELVSHTFQDDLTHYQKQPTEKKRDVGDVQVKRNMPSTCISSPRQIPTHKPEHVFPETFDIVNPKYDSANAASEHDVSKGSYGQPQASYPASLMSKCPCCRKLHDLDPALLVVHSILDDFVKSTADHQLPTHSPIHDIDIGPELSSSEAMVETVDNLMINDAKKNLVGSDGDDDDDDDDEDGDNEDNEESQLIPSYGPSFDVTSFENSGTLNSPNELNRLLNDLEYLPSRPRCNSSDDADVNAADECNDRFDLSLEESIDFSSQMILMHSSQSYSVVETDLDMAAEFNPHVDGDPPSSDSECNEESNHKAVISHVNQLLRRTSSYRRHLSDWADLSFPPIHPHIRLVQSDAQSVHSVQSLDAQPSDDVQLSANLSQSFSVCLPQIPFSPSNTTDRHLTDLQNQNISLNPKSIRWDEGNDFPGLSPLPSGSSHRRRPRAASFLSSESAASSTNIDAHAETSPLVFGFDHGNNENTEYFSNDLDDYSGQNGTSVMSSNSFISLDLDLSTLSPPTYQQRHMDQMSISPSSSEQALSCPERNSSCMTSYDDSKSPLDLLSPIQDRIIPIESISPLMLPATRHPLSELKFSRSLTFRHLYHPNHSSSQSLPQGKSEAQGQAQTQETQGQAQARITLGSNAISESQKPSPQARLLPLTPLAENPEKKKGRFIFPGSIMHQCSNSGDNSHRDQRNDSDDNRDNHSTDHNDDDLSDDHNAGHNNSDDNSNNNNNNNKDNDDDRKKSVVPSLDSKKITRAPKLDHEKEGEFILETKGDDNVQIVNEENTTLPSDETFDANNEIILSETSLVASLSGAFKRVWYDLILGMFISTFLFASYRLLGMPLKIILNTKSPSSSCQRWLQLIGLCLVMSSVAIAICWLPTSFGFSIIDCARIGCLTMVIIAFSRKFNRFYPSDTKSLEYPAVWERTVVAHRGGKHADCPENSVAAFLMAKKKKADAIELDCRLTKDGVCVVIHDATIERVLKGSGRVCQMTYEEIKRFQYKEGSPDARVPTLAEVLLMCMKLDLKILIEIKEMFALLRSQRICEIAVGLIRELDMKDQAAVISFNPLVICQIRALDQSIQTCLLSTDNLMVSYRDGDHEQLPFVLHHLAPYLDALLYYSCRHILPYVLGCSMIGLNQRCTTADMIKTFRERNLLVYIYTVNNYQQMENFHSLHASVATDVCL